MEPPASNQVLISRHDTERIAYWLPRGCLLIEDLSPFRPEDDTWSVKLYYFDETGEERHATHFHESYEEEWRREPERQLRKLKVPLGDWDEARPALQLAMDIRLRPLTECVADVVKMHGTTCRLFAASEPIYLAQADPLQLARGRCRDLASRMNEIGSQVDRAIPAAKLDALFQEAIFAVSTLHGEQASAVRRLEALASFDSSEPMVARTRAEQAAAVILTAEAEPSRAVLRKKLLETPQEGGQTQTLASAGNGAAMMGANQPADPLERLSRTRTVLRERADGKCPECSKSLTYSDALDLERDAVERTWRCAARPACKYEQKLFGVPISEWTDSDRNAWLREAAAKRAREALIRCPNCGHESIQADETGVRSIGTASHVRLNCKTPGCDFVERKAERAVKATVVANLRYALLLAAVGGSLLTIGYVAKTCGAGLTPQITAPSSSDTLLPSASSHGTTPTADTAATQRASLAPSATGADELRSTTLDRNDAERAIPGSYCINQVSLAQLYCPGRFRTAADCEEGRKEPIMNLPMPERNCVARPPLVFCYAAHDGGSFVTMCFPSPASCKAHLDGARRVAAPATRFVGECLPIVLGDGPKAVVAAPAAGSAEASGLDAALEGKWSGEAGEWTFASGRDGGPRSYRRAPAETGAWAVREGALMLWPDGGGNPKCSSATVTGSSLRLGPREGVQTGCDWLHTGDKRAVGQGPLGALSRK